MAGVHFDDEGLVFDGGEDQLIGSPGHFRELESAGGVGDGAAGGVVEKDANPRQRFARSGIGDETGQGVGWLLCRQVKKAEG